MAHAAAKSAQLKSSKPKINRKSLLGLLAFLLLLYVVLPQISKFRTSLGMIRSANLGWTALGLIFALATYLAAAGIYKLLAKKLLRYGPTLLVQVAGMFANRLLPAGIGAIGVSYKYLRTQKHTPTQAAAVVAVNNITGFIGHIILVCCTLILTGAITKLVLPSMNYSLGWVVGGAILLLVVIILAWFKKIRHKAIRAIKDVLKNLAGYRTHPLRLLGALLLSMCLTSLYTLCLLACCRAVGIEFGFGQILIALTLGVAGGTVTPTPGGLVGAEAGLVAGLMVYGAPAAVALAAVLIYRLLTYWLPLLLGGAAFAASEHKKYL